jgi:hypothetical protein
MELARGARAPPKLLDRAWTAGVAGQLWALWPLLVGDAPVTARDTIYRSIGGSFVAAGLIAWQRRPANRVGALMVATGFLFYVEVVARQLDPSVIQTLGLVVAGYWTIPFVVLLLVFPRGRWISGWLEQLLVATFAAHLVLQLVWLLVLERPGLANDIGFFPSERAGDRIHDAQVGVLLLAAGSLFLVLGWRWWRATPPLRRVLAPVLVGRASSGCSLPRRSSSGASRRRWGRSARRAPPVRRRVRATDRINALGSAGGRLWSWRRRGLGPRRLARRAGGLSYAINLMRDDGAPDSRAAALLTALHRSLAH